MKAFRTLFCAACMMLAAQVAYAYDAEASKNSEEGKITEIKQTEQTMYFSTKYVVETHYYGAKEHLEQNEYYVIYNDVDAAVENEPIRVEMEFFEDVEEVLHINHALHGATVHSCKLRLWTDGIWRVTNYNE